MIKISVAICTWNRSRLLRQTLERLTTIDTDRSFTWELVIVNNNSTDDTAAVIEEFSDRLPITSLFEAIPGHSRCRNRAIDAATGDYMVWTDNDVLVDRRWLVAYFDAFRAEPDAAFFGGPIEPVFEPTGRPDWLTETWTMCQAVYATRLLGDQAIDLHERMLPYGANFAVRMDVQRVNRYDCGLGRVASQMIGDDETSVLRKIATGGGLGRWVPKARINHFIPIDRASELYVRNYFVGQGQTNVLLEKQEHSPRTAFYEAWWHGMLYRCKRRFVEPDEWVSHMIRSAIAWGEFSGMRAYRSRKPSSPVPTTAFAKSS